MENSSGKGVPATFSYLSLNFADLSQHPQLDDFFFMFLETVSLIFRAQMRRHLVPSSLGTALRGLVDFYS